MRPSDLPKLFTLAACTWHLESSIVLAPSRDTYMYGLGSSRASSSTDYVCFLSRLTPVPCREHIAQLAQRYFNRTGIAAEIGVREGEFTVHNLLHWRGVYYGIDAWTTDEHIPGCRGSDQVACRNFASKLHPERRYDKALRATARWRDRCHLVRALSTQSAQQFADGKFDLVYLDALHTKPAVREDLHAWWPKLRAGGLFSGDDYLDMERTEYLESDEAANATAIVYGHVPRHFKWGVIGAVTEFAREKEAILRVTWHKLSRGSTSTLPGTW